MFVDGDDWLESNAIDIMIKMVLSNQTDACFSNRYYRNESDVTIATHFDAASKVPSCELVERHLKNQFIASACFAIVRLAKVKNCFFDESIYEMEDWEYNFRMLNCIACASIIDTPLYHYRSVDGSASQSKLNARKMTCFLIPERVESHIQANQLHYENATDYLWIFLLNHALVLLANNEYAPKEAAALKKIAQSKLLTCERHMPFRQRIYTLMCAISPRLFCWAYGLKHLWGK